MQAIALRFYDCKSSTCTCCRTSFPCNKRKKHISILYSCWWSTGRYIVVCRCVNSSAIVRVDRFDWDTDGGDPVNTRLIAGLAYHFLPHNFALLSLDRVSYDGGAKPTDWQIQLTLQVSYPVH